MTYKTALVTGGAGFIGSHLVDALVADGVKVFIVDDLSTGNRANLNPGAEFFKVSIASPRFTKLVVTLKPEIIFHAAAQVNAPKSVRQPLADAQTNVMGTVRLIEAAAKAGVKKIVFSSTGGALYSDARWLPFKEEAPVEPLSPYGIAKRAAEMYLFFAQNIYGISCVALRYANVYGPRQNAKGEAAVIATFVNGLLHDIPVLIEGTGKNTRDFVYVDDVVAANILAAQKNVTGVFNIGTGNKTSVLTVFKILSKLTSTLVPECHIPARPADVEHSVLNVRKAKKVLGWTPKISLKEGLKRTIEWYRKGLL